MQEAVFEVSMEVLEYIPFVVAGGIAVSVLVVSAVSAFVSGFKALLKVIGGR